MKFRKKPVVIEAVQFDGSKKSFDEIWDWMGGDVGPNCGYTGPSEDDPQGFKILTLEGRVNATLGDWIIKGIKGEFYPCKPDIFAATYEPVDE
jgi:hypothetical protein